MSQGGRRPGAGRPPGAVNKVAEEARRRALFKGVSPLEFLLKVMRDEGEDMPRRLDAAKAAIPFVHPKLQNIEAQIEGKQEVVGRIIFEGLTRG